MKNIPAILLSEELKRKYAKKEVLKAIETISHYGPLAGISGRSTFEFNNLANFMEKEIKRESKREINVGGGSEKRELQANERTTV